MIFINFLALITLHYFIVIPRILKFISNIMIAGMNYKKLLILLNFLKLVCIFRKC